MRLHTAIDSTHPRMLRPPDETFPCAVQTESEPDDPKDPDYRGCGEHGLVFLDCHLLYAHAWSSVPVHTCVCAHVVPMSRAGRVECAVRVRKRFAPGLIVLCMN